MTMWGEDVGRSSLFFFPPFLLPTLFQECAVLTTNDITNWFCSLKLFSTNYKTRRYRQHITTQSYSSILLLLMHIRYKYIRTPPFYHQGNIWNRNGMEQNGTELGWNKKYDWKQELEKKRTKNGNVMETRIRELNRT